MHPLVDQLRFTRSEFTRSLDGVTEEEGFQRFGVINSIGWIVGHVANQEQRYWRGRPTPLPGEPVARYSLGTASTSYVRTQEVKG